MISIEALKSRESHVGVVGLGYVGIPLMSALYCHFSVYGFDTDEGRIAALQEGIDPTGSIDAEQIGLMREHFTADARVLTGCSFVIIAVPTPITTDKLPDLRALESAARIVGNNLRTGAVVVVESTVYPGVTEDVVAAIIGGQSGLQLGSGFHIGYSPERINPGDSTHSVVRLVKVVAGASSRVSNLMASVYGTITGGKVYQAASIRTAEAAKVIENAQRDLNIALMNEVAMICNRLGLDTTEVIDAASTKWNFARYEPGLVGGHCIGIDPYYLTYAAQQAGYRSKVILAGRSLNETMGRYVANQALALLRRDRGSGRERRVLILGLTFKENVRDIRNTQVIDIIEVLSDQDIGCSVFDPEADPGDAHALYGIRMLRDASTNAPYDAVIVAVKHDRVRSQFTLAILRKIVVSVRPVLIDVKGIYDREESRRLGFVYWRL